MMIVKLLFNLKKSVKKCIYLENLVANHCPHVTV